MNTKSGFTLVELLVVIAIIGVLVGITLPAVQSVRESARRTDCTNRLKQVSLAVLNYESAHRRLPPGSTSHCTSWMTTVLPFVEQVAVFERMKTDLASYVDATSSNHAGLQTVIPVFQCASDDSAGMVHLVSGRLVATTSFQGVAGTDHLARDGVIFGRSKIRLSDIRDGQSNTLMIGERPPSKDRWYGWWYSGLGQDGLGSADFFLGVEETLATSASRLGGCPAGPYSFNAGQREQCDALHFWSNHPGGANFSRCDGSVAFVSYESVDTMKALSTRK